MLDVAMIAAQTGILGVVNLLNISNLFSEILITVKLRMIFLKLGQSYNYLKVIFRGNPYLPSSSKMKFFNL